MMRRALELAERGWGRTSPNPMVGAVVVREGRLVGEGWHRAYGAPHAEVEALEDAGDAAGGASLYVTLEPCDHAGKTPPCTRAILRADIRRVVVACRDPHPQAGGGLEALRREGLRVEVGVEGMAAARLNAPFLWSHARGEPFVTLKLALSLDGRIARREGERTRLTGDEAGAWVHRLRAGHGAVLVGRGTAEVDDPRLTARGDPEPRTPPVRVVLDSRLALPAGLRLFRSAPDPPTWVLCGPEAPDDRRAELEGAGVRVEAVAPARDGVGLAPGAVVGRLGEELDSVLVEGGGKVAASFLQAGVLQRMHLLYAPVVFGPEGVEGFPAGGTEAGAWEPVARRALGRDTLVTLESRELTGLLRRLSAPEDAAGASP